MGYHLLQQQYCHYPEKKKLHSFRGPLQSLSCSGKRHDTPTGPFLYITIKPSKCMLVK